MTDRLVGSVGGDLWDVSHKETLEESSESSSNSGGIVLHETNGHVVVVEGVVLGEESIEEVKALVDGTRSGADGL